MDCKELLDMFPDLKESMVLENVNFFKSSPSIMHLFKEIIQDYLKLKHDYNKSKDQKLQTAIMLKLESALNYVWENLHTGQWKDVDVLWRQMYSYVSLLKGYANIYFHSQDIILIFEQALNALDMGLIMGEPILNNILSKIADKLNVKLWELSSSKSIHELKKTCDECKGPYPSLDEKRLVETYHLPSIETFLLDIMGKKSAVITGSMDFWPAMNESRWSVDYLRKVAGHRTVPIELGSKYTDDAWSQSLITFNEFIDSYLLKPNKTTGYLAQYQLFQQVPKLQQDTLTPDYCYLGDSDEIQINAWFGPCGTVSPLHYDPEHNFLSQVVGSKYIRLYDERHSEMIYPHEQELLFNTSRVDVENPDHENFPMFASAPYVECILEPGQMLYIPPRMWHYVRSLSTSFSVSFWWK